MKLKVGDKFSGYYLFCGNKDVFFVTNAKAKTHNLLVQMCTKLNIPDAPSVLDNIKYNLRKATLEVKQTSNGEIYNNIYGDNFFGYGHFWKEEMDMVFDIR